MQEAPVHTALIRNYTSRQAKRSRTALPTAAQGISFCLHLPYAVTDKCVMEQLRRDLASAPLSGWRGDGYLANSGPEVLLECNSLNFFIKLVSRHLF